MSVTGRKSIGVPIVMIHEGEGCVLTVESVTGEVYKGHCVESEDNMNLQMKDVTMTDPKVRASIHSTLQVLSNHGAAFGTHQQTGKETFLPQIYIRGTQINFVIFPDILKHAPMFKRVDNAKHGKHVQGGMAFGRTHAIRAKGTLVSGPASVCARMF